MKHFLPLLTTLLLSPLAALQAATDKPNILIIYADDLGYGDVQCYNPRGGKIPTPHIDKLAAQGMRFTDGHSSSSVCSPSRYTLLTGRYHWRSRLQTGIVNSGDAPLITPDRLTIASLVQRQGYRTGCFGKWHLGWNWAMTAEQRPFVFGSESNGNMYDESLEGREKKKKLTVDWEKLTDSDPAPIPTEKALAAWKAVFSQPFTGGPNALGFDRFFGVNIPNWPPYCFIENDRTVGVPDAYLTPKQVKPRTLAFPQGAAIKGWQLTDVLPRIGDQTISFLDKSVKSRTPFLIYLSLTTPHTPLAVNAEWRGKSGLGDYADLVMETDAMVGRVLDALEKSGEAENTLVVFTSDNGCAGYIGVSDLENRGHYPSGPLRDYKSTNYEGGHRVPFIVRWSGTVKPGSVCDQLVQQADIMATIADVLRIKLPDNAGEDSFSLMPLFKGGDKPVRTNAVNCSVYGIPSVRDGRWKLILNPNNQVKEKALAAKSGSNFVPDPSPVQLYDLKVDLGESKNFAATMPEKVAEMKALLEKLINDGRSTPGVKQKNDVEVVRYPKVAATAIKPAK